jgi:RimJ/RimL family protein N-acetyltransferase
MQLESERLLLREFALADWPALNAYTSDPEVVKYMSFGPDTAAETREHLAHCLATAAEEPRRIYELAVVLRADQQLIGTATLALHPDERRHASFSYLFHPRAWATAMPRRPCAGWCSLVLPSSTCTGLRIPAIPAITPPHA